MWGCVRACEYLDLSRSQSYLWAIAVFRPTPGGSSSWLMAKPWLISPIPGIPLSINCITKPLLPRGKFGIPFGNTHFSCTSRGGGEILRPLSGVIFLPAKQTVPTALFAQYCWSNISDLCSSINWKAAKSTAIFGPESPRKKKIQNMADMAVIYAFVLGGGASRNSRFGEYKAQKAFGRNKQEINWEFVWAV